MSNRSRLLALLSAVLLLGAGLWIGVILGNRGNNQSSSNIGVTASALPTTPQNKGGSPRYAGEATLNNGHNHRLEVRDIIENEVGNHTAAWDKIEKLAVNIEVKNGMLEALLTELCENGEFALGLELLVEKIGPGTRRNHLLSSLFGNSSILPAQAFSAVESLDTRLEKRYALGAISLSFRAKGLKSSGLSGNEILSLTPEQASVFGAGVGKFTALSDAAPPVKAAEFAADTNFLDDLVSRASSTAERNAIEIARFEYLTSAAQVNPDKALETFNSSLDADSPSEDWFKAALNTGVALMSLNPKEVASLIASRDDKTASRLLGPLIGFWANNDLNAANGWLESNFSKLSQSQVDSASEELVAVSVRLGDPDGARKWLSLVKDPTVAKRASRFIK